MTTYLLLHGHFIGAWAWAGVVRYLGEGGHEAIAPDLIGLGGAASLASSATGLRAHVAQVTGIIREQELRDAVLVGHSYAGMVVAGVVGALGPEARERIRRLVFLDAPVPRDRQCLLDLLAEPVAQAIRQAAAGNGGWLVPAPPAAVAGIEGAAECVRIDALLTPVPLATCTEPLDAPGDPVSKLPRTYIRCLRYPPSGPVADSLRREPGWELREIDAGHLAMITHPERTAELLAETALQ